MTTHKNNRVFNFSDFGGPVYIGRPKGEKARETWKLDEVDNNDEIVTIKISDDTYSINSSFFLGLFAPSIKALGSRESFLKKYQFSMPDTFIDTVDSCILRALHEKQPLIKK